MKFRLVEDIILDEEALDEVYKKVNLTSLRQFLKSALNEYDDDTFGGFDIHHLDGNNKDSSAGNIVLLPHNIHSIVSRAKDKNYVRELLLKHAIKLNVSITTTHIDNQDLQSLYSEIIEEGN